MLHAPTVTSVTAGLEGFLIQTFEGGSPQDRQQYPRTLRRHQRPTAQRRMTSAFAEDNVMSRTCQRTSMTSSSANSNTVTSHQESRRGRGSLRAQNTMTSPDRFDTTTRQRLLTSRMKWRGDERLVDALKSLLKCPVCLDTCVSPKVLPCQHTVCLSCLRGIAASSYPDLNTIVRAVTCPLCRARHFVPMRGCAAFPDDFRVKQLADMIEVVESKRREDVLSLHEDAMSLETTTVASTGRSGIRPKCELCPYRISAAVAAAGTSAVSATSNNTSAAADVTVAAASTSMPVDVVSSADSSVTNTSAAVFLFPTAAATQAPPSSTTDATEAPPSSAAANETSAAAAHCLSTSSDASSSSSFCSASSSFIYSGSTAAAAAAAAAAVAAPGVPAVSTSAAGACTAADAAARYSAAYDGVTTAAATDATSANTAAASAAAASSATYTAAATRAATAAATAATSAVTATKAVLADTATRTATAAATAVTATIAVIADTATAAATAVTANATTDDATVGTLSTSAPITAAGDSTAATAAEERYSSCDGVTAAVQFCFDCGRFMCEECAGRHSSLPLMKDHFVSNAVSDGQENSSTNENINSNSPDVSTSGSWPWMCSKHHSEPYQYVCCDCSQRLCLFCLLTDPQHDGHAVLRLAEAIRHYEAGLRAAYELLLRLESSHQRTLQEITRLQVQHSLIYRRTKTRISATWKLPRCAQERMIAVTKTGHVGKMAALSMCEKQLLVDICKVSDVKDAVKRCISHPSTNYKQRFDQCSEVSERANTFLREVGLPEPLPDDLYKVRTYRSGEGLIILPLDTLREECCRCMRGGKLFGVIRADVAVSVVMAAAIKALCFP